MSQASIQTPEACRNSWIFCQIPETFSYSGCFVLMHGLILILSTLLFLPLKKTINIQRKREDKQGRGIYLLLVSDGSIGLIPYSCVCHFPLFKEFIRLYFFHMVDANLGSPLTKKGLAKRKGDASLPDGKKIINTRTLKYYFTPEGWGAIHRGLDKVQSLHGGVRG